MIYTIIIFILTIIIFLARFNFFRIPKKGILVLLYHRIDNSPTNTSLDKFSISLDTFEWQVKYIRKKGFKAIHPQDIEKIKASKLHLRNKYVLFTFDDGYKDNLKAAEILKKYGFYGIFFISTDLIGKRYNNVDMLTFEDLKTLKEMGMTLGSHSHEHKHLNSLDYTEAKEQISTSIKILNNIQKIEDFAYPFGNYNDKIMEILKDLNIKRAYIIGQRIYDPQNDSSLKIPRAIIRRDTTKLDFYLIATRGRSKF